MNKKILFKNLGFLLSDNVIKLVIGFFISIFIARYLGSENLGKVNYCYCFLKSFSNYETNYSYGSILN